MSAIAYAINAVMNSDIPDVILEDAFITKKDRYNRVRLSIEEQIKRRVLDRRVLADLATMNGVEVDLRLAGLPFETKPNYERVYTIPIDVTLGRPIIAVELAMLDVTRNHGGQGAGIGSSTQGFATSPLESAMLTMVDANNPVPRIGNARVQLLNPNTIMIRDYMNFRSDLNIRLTIAHDEELSNLKKVYYIDFAELVTLAVKAYIYKNLMIEIDMAKLSGGRELGSYRNFIETYSDSNQQYLDLLNEKWSKILVLNSPEQKRAMSRFSGRTKV